MNYLNNVIFVNTKDEAPKVEHWAIFEFGKIHIPGDERSRTNPGHGYPAEDRPHVTYKAFLNEADWEKAVEEQASKLFGTPFIAAKVTPAQIQTVTKIVINKG